MGRRGYVLAAALAAVVAIVGGTLVASAASDQTSAKGVYAVYADSWAAPVTVTNSTMGKGDIPHLMLSFKLPKRSLIMARFSAQTSCTTEAGTPQPCSVRLVMSDNASYGGGGVMSPNQPDARAEFFDTAVGPADAMEAHAMERFSVQNRRGRPLYLFAAWEVPPQTTFTLQNMTLSVELAATSS